jgi:hypothetical protein
MKKAFDFRQLSDRKCRECGRQLKRNLIEKKPKADLCYKCFKKMLGQKGG